jgi:translocator protein
VVQALPSQRQNALLRRLGYLPAVSGILNTLWVVAWHYEAFAATVPIMVALLVTLVAIHRRARGPEAAGLSFRQRAAFVAPWSLYLGWITVATIANVSQMLLWAGFTGGGIPQEVWALGVLLLGMAIAATVVIRSRDALYGAVVIWAYAAIAVKQVAPLAVAGALIGVIVIAALAAVAAWRVLDDARAGRPSRTAAQS